VSALRVRRPGLDGAVRLRRWRVDPDYVHLSLPAHRFHPLGPGELRQHLDEVYAGRARGIVTSALSVGDQQVFRDMGFAVVQRLHLLRRTFDRPVPRPSRRTRRGRRRDHDAILSVDHAAFVPFWQLDRSLLADALSATPSVRLRVVDDGRSRPAGYAISGRSQTRGYVQRLAIHPDHQGQGLGAALLADGLGWLARWRVRDALVNTQVDNERSLRLYQDMGFELQRHGLAVLRLDFSPAYARANVPPEIMRAR
jgi:ribosomal protein S18 acetylase RimI-like enzyme